MSYTVQLLYTGDIAGRQYLGLFCCNCEAITAGFCCLYVSAGYHLSEKSGNVWEFHSGEGNVRKFNKSQMSQESIRGKSCQRELFVTYFVFGGTPEFNRLSQALCCMFKGVH